MNILHFSNHRFVLFAVFISLLFSLSVQAQNSAPIVSNVRFQQRLENSCKVDIYYDVNDSDGAYVTITVQASSDGGNTWTLPITNVTGDIGANVIIGTGKKIVWDLSTEHSSFFSNSIKVQVTAHGGINSCSGIPTVTYACKTYNTVQIFNQCWLIEKLDVGTMI